MRMRKLLGLGNMLIAAVLLLVAWGLVTLVASRPAFKHLFDLTPQKTATVSRVTEDLIAELRRQELKVEFHLFFQPLYNPPAGDREKADWEITQTLQNLTRDLLRHYAYLGGDTVRVFDYNLDREFEESRKAAERFAVTATNTVVVVLGNRHKKLSLHLDLGVIDLPSITPGAGPVRRQVNTLKDYRGEEALTSAIQGLMITGRPIVYFLSGYGDARLDRSTGGDYSSLNAVLQSQGFDVRDLALRQTQAIPDDASALALLEPTTEFTDRETDLLVDWLRRGGRMFVNYGFSELPDRNPTGGEFGRRLGFQLTRDPVYAMVPAQGTKVAGNPQVRNITCMYSPRHPITGPLVVAKRVLGLQYAREIEFVGTPQGVRLEGIVRSDVDSWIARPRQDQTGMLRYDDYQQPKLDGAFAPRDVGIVADLDGEPKGTTGHVVVLSGFAFNNLMFPQNGDLALSIFNWLADRSVLVSIPTERYQAHLLKIGYGQAQAIWWLLVVGVPVFFLVLGFLVYWRRSRWK